MKKKFQAHNAHRIIFFSSPFIHVLKLNASFNLAIFAACLLLLLLLLREGFIKFLIKSSLGFFQLFMLFSFVFCCSSTLFHILLFSFSHEVFCSLYNIYQGKQATRNIFQMNMWSMKLFFFFIFLFSFFVIVYKLDLLWILWVLNDAK